VTISRRDSYGSGFYACITDGSARSAERVLPLVFDLVRPSSVVDLGCGTGAWLAIAGNLGAGKILGIDGDWVPSESLLIPPECFQGRDLAQPLGLEQRFDLAMCLEVAEHLDASQADGLIENLCALADVVLFSAAIPGQGGMGHLNEQWPPYWQKRFAQHGFKLVDCLRSRLWADEAIEPWYAQNAMLYVKPGRLDADPRIRQAAAETGGMPLCAVHPRLFRLYSAPSVPPDPEPAVKRITPCHFAPPASGSFGWSLCSMPSSSVSRVGVWPVAGGLKG
jgi:SAM-dependent methyltransferase